MTGNERRALGCALFATLYTAFPFEHGPALKAVLREFGKNSLKVDLPITQRAEPARPVDPRLVPAVDTLPARRMEFRILHVKHFDPAVIQIDVFQIVELLKHKMAGIKKQIAARMVLHLIQKHLDGRAVVQILSWVNFKT